MCLLLRINLALLPFLFSFTIHLNYFSPSFASSVCLYHLSLSFTFVLSLYHIFFNTISSLNSVSDELFCILIFHSFIWTHYLPSRYPLFSYHCIAYKLQEYKLFLTGRKHTKKNMHFMILLCFLHLIGWTWW